MALFVFVVDTSASMNQRTPNGMTYLDCAKSAIEYFVEKLRARDPTASRTDKYLLVTCDDGMDAYKVGMTDRAQTFLDELKNLRAFDLSDVGAALKKALAILSNYRVKVNLDNVGMGRLPWSCDPTVISVFTDGGQLTDTAGVVSTLALPPNPPMLGQEFFREPFRWDQRIFGFVLRFSSQQLPSSALKQSTLSPISEATGGKATIYTNMKQLIGGVESLAQKLQLVPGSAGIVVTLDPLPSTDNPNHAPPPAPKKQIFVKVGQQGAWPFPDDFIALSSMNTLPQRSAHPVIRFNPVPSIVPNHPTDFAVDRYPLEPCALTDWMLSTTNPYNITPESNQPIPGDPNDDPARKNKNLLCYECCIVPSNPDAMGGIASPPGAVLPYPPFGFLKPHFENNAVYLYVLPLNYHYLFQLLHNWHASTSSKWKLELDKYLHLLPPIYLPFLKAALKRWTPPPTPAGHPVLSTQSVIPEPLGSTQVLSYAMQGALRDHRLRATEEANKLEAIITGQREQVKMKRALAQSGLDSHASLPNVGPLNPKAASRVMDVYSVDPANLELYVEQLQTKIFSKLHFGTQPAATKKSRPVVESKHRVPIRDMGNYQEFLLKQQNLRKLDTSADSDKPYFGNPFVKMKNSKIPGFADEVDLGRVSEFPLPGAQPTNGRGIKRKSAPATSASRQAELRKKQTKGPAQATPHEATPPVSPVPVPEAPKPALLLPPQVTPLAPPPMALPPVAGIKKQAPVAVPSTPKLPIDLKKPAPITSPAAQAKLSGGPSAAATAATAVVTQLSTSEKLAQVRYNNSIKIAIIGLLRKPNKVDTQILEKLNQVTGDVRLKQQFFEEVAHIATLYRKKVALPTSI